MYRHCEKKNWNKNMSQSICVCKVVSEIATGTAQIVIFIQDELAFSCSREWWDATGVIENGERLKMLF